MYIFKLAVRWDGWAVWVNGATSSWFGMNEGVLLCKQALFFHHAHSAVCCRKFSLAMEFLRVSSTVSLVRWCGQNTSRRYNHRARVTQERKKNGKYNLVKKSRSYITIWRFAVCVPHVFRLFVVPFSLCERIKPLFATRACSRNT